MTKVLLALIGVLVLDSKTHAAEAFNCLGGKEEIAEQKMITAVRNSIAALFKKKEISYDPAKITFIISAAQSQVNHNGAQDIEADPYGQFEIWDGKILSSSGTEFNLSFVGDEDQDPTDHYYAYYAAISSNSGFDKEGNAIHPHCVLKHDDPFILNLAKFVEVQNTKSGKVLGKFTLPARIVIF